MSTVFSRLLLKDFFSQEARSFLNGEVIFGMSPCWLRGTHPVVICLYLLFCINDLLVMGADVVGQLSLALAGGVAVRGWSRMASRMSFCDWRRGREIVEGMTLKGVRGSKEFKSCRMKIDTSR